MVLEIIFDFSGNTFLCSIPVSVSLRAQTLMELGLKFSLFRYLNRNESFFSLSHSSFASLLTELDEKRWADNLPCHFRLLHT